jgi:DNA-binding response OmpR family regulator
VKRIIVVEDDPGILDALSEVFDAAIYDVTNFRDAEPILNGRYERPDLFILDKQLSGIDGLDICRFLKKQESTKDIPVIMLSASPGIDKMAKAAGADDAIEKPFTLKLMRETLNKYLV